MSLVDLLLSTKKKDDIVPNVTGMATGTERKRELCGAGALGALLG